MTNKELLEYAAKAVGLKNCANVMGLYVLEDEDRYWNPLTDDGDALRLAVKLKLKIVHFGLAVVVEYNGTTHIEVNELVNEDTGDRYAATRQAIVRAAAEIGKN